MHVCVCLQDAVRNHWPRRGRVETQIKQPRDAELMRYVCMYICMYGWLGGVQIDPLVLMMHALIV